MIDYGVLHDSTQHYSKLGYNRVETPWLVTKAINNITCPTWVELSYVHKGGVEKVFVGSGEQSFLYQINKGFIPPGKYQTITPCIRNDAFDQWHTKYFVKNELINFGDDVYDDDVEPMIQDALSFLRKEPSRWDGGVDKLKVVKINENMWDIEYEGIELGSYGYRECEFTKWVYGTGVAEPRYSRLMALHEREAVRNGSICA